MLPVKQPSATLTPSRQVSDAKAAAVFARSNTDADGTVAPLAAAFTRAAQRINSNVERDAVLQPPDAVAPHASAIEPGNSLPGSVNTSLAAAVATPAADDHLQIAEDVEAKTEAGQSIAVTTGAMPELSAQNTDAALAPYITSAVPLSDSAAEQAVLQITAGNTF